MKVLGVMLDSKLQWVPQVAQTITKAKRALHAIRLIKPSFNNQELRLLITSNFYSELYYNSEIWHIPTLNVDLKQQLLSASAIAPKIYRDNDTRMMAFIDSHKINEQYMFYKHSL